MTLGPAAIFCAYAERWRGWLKDALVMYGRVPFAFYIVHWFLIHTLCLVLGAVQGVPVTALMDVPGVFPPEYGLPLPGVYLVWLLGRGLAVSVGALDDGRQDAQPRLVAELRLRGHSSVAEHGRVPQAHREDRTRDQHARQHQHGPEEPARLVSQPSHRARADGAAERTHGIDQCNGAGGGAAHKKFSRQSPERAARGVVADCGDAERQHRQRGYMHVTHCDETQRA